MITPYLFALCQAPMPTLTVADGLFVSYLYIRCCRGVVRLIFGCVPLIGRGQAKFVTYIDGSNGKALRSLD